MRWSLALLPVALLLGFLIHSGALTSMRGVLDRAGALAWSLALLGQTLSYAGRAARLQITDRSLYRGRFWTCLRLILVNNALNLVLPMRSGEASFPLLLRRWFGADLARATGTLIWMRLLDLQVLALAALLSLQLLHGAALAAASPRLWQALMLLLLAAPLLLWALHAPLQRVVARRGGKPAALVARVLDGMPARLPMLLVAWLWTLASWGVKLLVLGHLLAALAGLGEPAGVLGAIGADLSTVLPIHSPGGFGTFEAALIAFVDALTPGVAANAELLAAALSFHLFVLGFALLAGAAAWLVPGREPRPRGASEPDAA